MVRIKQQHSKLITMTVSIIGKHCYVLKKKNQIYPKIVQKLAGFVTLAQGP